MDSLHFGPVGLIGEKWQVFQGYEIVGDKKIEAEDEIILKVAQSQVSR